MEAARNDVGGQDDHARRNEYADDERRPETLHDARDLLEEIGLFDLLDCRRPPDVVGEHVRED